MVYKDVMINAEAFKKMMNLICVHSSPPTLHFEHTLIQSGEETSDGVSENADIYSLSGFSNRHIMSLISKISAKLLKKVFVQKLFRYSFQENAMHYAD